MAHRPSVILRLFLSALKSLQSKSLSTEPALQKTSPYWPGLGGPVFLFLLSLFFFARPLLLLGDGGTCRHFLTGMYVLEQHRLPSTIYMSAVEPGSTWITHELFCDLLFGLPFAWLGLNWIVLTASLAIVLSLTWSYQMARQRGSGPFLALTAMVLALEACSVHWSARPHVFTYLLFLACYFECFIAQSSRLRRYIVLPIIMLVWGNTHGSFALGLAMIVLRALGDCAERIFKKAAESDSSQPAKVPDRSFISPATANPGQIARDTWTFRESAVLFTLSLTASCLNLRGAGLVTYVISYLTSPKIQAQSDEWRSLDFGFAAPVWSFILLAGLVLTVWVYSRAKPKLGEFFYMSFLFFAGIYAMRLIPYFALAALPAMAAQAAELKSRQSLCHIPILEKLRTADERAAGSEFTFVKYRFLYVGLAALLSMSFLFIPAFKISDFDPTRLPVRAVNFMKDNNISGLGFTRDNWGSYLYWRLKDKIFIDDRTDFYSQTLLNDYTTIYLTLPGWQNKLSKYPIKFVLVPHGLPLEFMLDNKQGWKRMYQDNTAVLFSAQNSSAATQERDLPTGKQARAGQEAAKSGASVRPEKKGI